MSKSKNHKTNIAAIAIAALCFTQPAAADTIEINNFWAGSGNVTIDFSGINWHDGSTVTGLHEYGGSGGFLTYNLSEDPLRKNGFQSFCVDIFHSFSFAVSSTDILQPASIISTAAAAALGQLYSNNHAAIDSRSSSGTNESAFQLAVWEIVNEGTGSYNLGNGNFKASGTGSALAQTWLNDLGTSTSSDYTANIWTVQSMITTGKGYAQDVVVFTPVPEPLTIAMLVSGLGLIGYSTRRRRNDNLDS